MSTATERAQTTDPVEAPEVVETSGLAIAGLITSVLLWPIGLILSLLALRDVRPRKNKNGRGMAIAGLILTVPLALATILLAIGISVLLNNLPGSDSGPLSDGVPMEQGFEGTAPVPEGEIPGYMEGSDVYGDGPTSGEIQMEAYCAENPEDPMCAEIPQ